MRQSKVNKMIAEAKANKPVASLRNRKKTIISDAPADVALSLLERMATNHRRDLGIPETRLRFSNTRKKRWMKYK